MMAPLIKPDWATVLGILASHMVTAISSDPQ